MSSIMIFFSSIVCCLIRFDSIRFDSIRFDSVWYVMKLLGQICLDCFDFFHHWSVNPVMLYMIALHNMHDTDIAWMKQD